MKADAWTKESQTLHWQLPPDGGEGLGRGVSTAEGRAAKRNGSSETRIGRPPPHPFTKLCWQREGQSDAASKVVPAVQRGNTTLYPKSGGGRGSRHVC